MTTDVNVILAVWAALTEAATDGPWHGEAGNVVSKVEHRCVNCECPWPCPTEQAARKWLGGEGRG